jgi:hypothetical protein
MFRKSTKIMFVFGLFSGRLCSEVIECPPAGCGESAPNFGTAWLESATVESEGHLVQRVENREEPREEKR